MIDGDDFVRRGGRAGRGGQAERSDQAIFVESKDQFVEGAQPRKERSPGKSAVQEGAVQEGADQTVDRAISK